MIRLLADPSHEARAHAASSAPAGRLIAVGVRDPEYDAAALAWAVADAQADCDAVHVVHAYVPLRLEGCAWEPVARERDARYLTGSRVAARAVQTAVSLDPGLRTGGSTIAGLPEDVLIELSTVVDLLVVGDDSAAPPGSRRIAWRVQDAAGCPVVAIPHGWRATALGHPVTLVVDELGIRPGAMRHAVSAALRRGSGLRVTRTWRSLHEDEQPSPGWLAHQQEELDTQLADWRERYPQLALTARIEFGEDDWLRPLAAASSLIVVDVRAAAAVRTMPAGHPVLCPTVVAPARPARSSRCDEDERPGCGG